MRTTKRKVAALMIIIVVSIVGYATWEMYLKYLPAEERLKTEYSALNIPPEFVLISSVLKSNTSMSSSPSLRNVYKVEGTREYFGQILKQRFEDRGYEVEYIAGHVFVSSKNNIRAHSSSTPRLETGTASYATNEQQKNQQISEITLILEYTP